MGARKSKPAMRISQVAAAAGLSRQTIQYYLLLGLIRATAHTKGGQRLFDQSTVRRVKLIHKLNQSGYMLREIRDVFLRNTDQSPPRQSAGTRRRPGRQQRARSNLPV